MTVSPTPVLILTADTGGGHRGAAEAIAGALSRDYPGAFAPALFDPLPRGLTRWYGPVARWAPWVWAVAFHGSNSRGGAALLDRSLPGARRAVAAAAARYRAGVLVCCHPLTVAAAVRTGLPVVTVVTDLVRPHACWRATGVAAVTVPSSATRWRGPREVAGVPVSATFGALPEGASRAGLRRHLGLAPDRFTIVLTGGGEGAGALARQVRALLRRFADVQVVLLCGRNQALYRRMASHSGGRLTVRPFVTDMADWLRCADLVVGKAGPGTVAEAACCGAPLVLTGELPGQERGNIDLVVGAGAGRRARSVRDLLAQVTALRANPAALEAMRAAAARFARPAAATTIAAVVAAARTTPGGTDEMDCDVVGAGRGDGTPVAV